MRDSAVIFDLDGTIANHAHRLHFLEDKEKNWDIFFSFMENDTPIIPIVNLYHIIQSSNQYKMIIITGRPNRYREITEKWLSYYKISYDELHMRNNEDFRVDFIFKEDVLFQLNEHYCVELVFDDRKDVVNMWRKNGLICLQVQDNF